MRDLEADMLRLEQRLASLDSHVVAFVAGVEADTTALKHHPGKNKAFGEKKIPGAAVLASRFTEELTFGIKPGEEVG